MAVASGIASGSVVLLGYGLDSLIEMVSGVVVGLRLRTEIRGSTASLLRAAERRAALAGLLANALLGWWWADPIAALVLVPWMAREGLEPWRPRTGGVSAAR